jgi:DNA polymerase-3 subunit gamma/tau
VRGKKRLLASLLEHGRPLAVAEQRLEIGFTSGSFELKQVQDQDVQGELRALAKAYFRAETDVRLVPLSDKAADAPPSLVEKKSREAANRRHELHQQTTGHPLVAAAVEIFGGEIAEIKENGEK